MISFLEKESTEVSASRDPVLDNRKGPAKASPLPYQGFDSIPPFAAKAKQVQRKSLLHDLRQSIYSAPQIRVSTSQIGYGSTPLMSPSMPDSEITTLICSGVVPAGSSTSIFWICKRIRPEVSVLSILLVPEIELLNFAQSAGHLSFFAATCKS